MRRVALQPISLLLYSSFILLLQPARMRAEVADATSSKLYGLVRVSNLPVYPALVSIDPDSGTLSFVGDGNGAALPTIAGDGDLAAVDQNAGLYYYLGDAGNGTTRLAAVSLADGSEACSVPVPQIAQLDCVGCGQTLSLDRVNGSLLLTGISR